jgi:hypothetical protein
MRQPGRGGRCRPRSLGAWPRGTQVPVGLFQVPLDWPVRSVSACWWRCVAYSSHRYADCGRLAAGSADESDGYRKALTPPRIAAGDRTGDFADSTTGRSWNRGSLEPGTVPQGPHRAGQSAARDVTCGVCACDLEWRGAGRNHPPGTAGGQRVFPAGGCSARAPGHDAGVVAVRLEKALPGTSPSARATRRTRTRPGITRTPARSPARSKTILRSGGGSRSTLV